MFWDKFKHVAKLSKLYFIGENVWFYLHNALARTMISNIDFSFNLRTQVNKLCFICGCATRNGKEEEEEKLFAHFQPYWK